MGARKRGRERESERELKIEAGDEKEAAAESLARTRPFS